MKMTDSQNEAVKWLKKNVKPIPEYEKRLPRAVIVNFYNPLMEKRGFVRIEEVSKEAFEVTFWQKPRRGKSFRMDKPETYSTMEIAMERAKNYVITWATAD